MVISMAEHDVKIVESKLALCADWLRANLRFKVMLWLSIKPRTNLEKNWMISFASCKVRLWFPNSNENDARLTRQFISGINNDTVRSRVLERRLQTRGHVWITSLLASVLCYLLVIYSTFSLFCVCGDEWEWRPQTNINFYLIEVSSDYITMIICSWYMFDRPDAIKTDLEFSQRTMS